MRQGRQEGQRAYMSKPGDARGGARMAVAMGLDHVAEAEREARAILAETEPYIKRGNRHLADTGYWQIAPPCAYRDLCGKALAESLAAFIAMEIS